MPPAYDASYYINEASELLSSVQSLESEHGNIAHSSAELSALIMRLANQFLPSQEKKRIRQLKKSLENIKTKAFMFETLDTLFRSSSDIKTAQEISKIISYYGFPSGLPFSTKLKIYLFTHQLKNFTGLTVPISKKTIINSYSHLIVPDDPHELERYLKTRKEENSPLNICLIKEEAIGENEAKEQIGACIDLLSNPNIDHISIKISTISSQIRVNAFAASVESVAAALRQIYRAAMSLNKFVNIDMESYRYFAIAVGAFKKVLDEEEFKNFHAGITLQSYLPNSFPILKTLIKWSRNRRKEGGAHITIALVKGAYLSKEQFSASENGWPQAPYLEKLSTDANYKRMLDYALCKENMASIHLDICTHNIFDIAYALVLKNYKRLDDFSLGFQMFEGRTQHIRKALEKIYQQPIRLYAPIYHESHFNDAINYIQRRLEENIGHENFLKYVSDLSPGNESWEAQEGLFLNSVDKIPGLSSSARRSYGKKSIPISASFYGEFENEAHTDFTLPSKIFWQNQILKRAENMEKSTIPLVIANEEKTTAQKTHFSPSDPLKEVYSFSLAAPKEINQVIQIAKKSEESWQKVPLEEKRKIIAKAAAIYRDKRAHFIEIMMADSAKTFVKADCEVSESIDIIEYYQTRVSKIIKMSEIEFSPKGTIFIASARSMPYCSPIGGIVAALITGNTVIFKPPPDTVLTGYHLVKALWKAGIPQEVLQFINCTDEVTEKFILPDNRISAVLLAGKLKTVEKFLSINPLLDLSSSSEGKNTMIITSLSDKSLAIKNLVNSAFTFSGQQYSCTSIAILEEEVYNDLSFRKKLVDATASLKVGSIWSPDTDIGPLMHQPDDQVIKELTTLHGNEKWLLKPVRDHHNPLLWSPGIKLGVTTSSPLYNNFLPGPILGLMKAEDFSHALKIANSTKYGLCASLQSLDEDEHLTWKNSIEAGNLYINGSSVKSMTRRTPFGGTKKSSYGIGFKAGGPNYLLRCVEVKQKSLPQEKHPVNEKVNSLTSFIEKIELSAEELGLWYASIANYSYWWQRLRTYRDPTKIIGQDNFFGYTPFNFISIRVTDEAKSLDVLRICAACLTCKTPFELSYGFSSSNRLSWSELSSLCETIEESEEKYINRCIQNQIPRIRIAAKAPKKMKIALSKNMCFINDRPVLASGRIELLNYVREISICKNYHRNGNLGTRESELRKPPI